MFTNASDNQEISLPTMVSHLLHSLCSGESFFFPFGGPGWKGLLHQEGKLAEISPKYSTCAHRSTVGSHPRSGEFLLMFILVHHFPVVPVTLFCNQPVM